MITQQQRIERTEHIGSSDVAAIMGYSPFAGPAEIWASKTMEIEDKTNAAMRRGISLEPLILRQAENELGKPIIPDQRFISADDPLFAANLDGWIIDGKIIIEAKSTGTWDGWGDDGSEVVPEAYYLQVQHQMFCAESPVAQIWAAVPNMRTAEFETRQFIIPRNNDVITAIKNTCREFWDNYVATKTPPPSEPKRVEFWSTVKRVDGESMEIPPAIYAEYCAATIFKRQAEARADAAKAKVLLAMGTASIGTVDGRPVVTPQTQNRFDTAKFRADHPDIYEAYTKPGTPFSRFKSVKGE